MAAMEQASAVYQDSLVGVVPSDPPTRGLTLQHQDSLPKMPVPALEHCCDRYLSAVLPLLSAEEKDGARASVEAFLKGDGPSLYEALQAMDKDKPNYIEDFYREIYTGAGYSSYSLNPNFVLDRGLPGDDGASTAAFLAASSLQYFMSIQTGKMEPLMTRKGALDMRQFPWIFGSARISTSGGVDLSHSFLDSSNHIAVLCRGLVYKLQVLSEGKAIIASQALLAERFAQIQAHAAAAVPNAASPTPEASMPLLTTAGDRGIWEQARIRLMADPANAEVLAAVDEALFLVSLDAVTDLSPEDMERNVLYGLPGTVQNRWLDKWAWIVCEDGHSGVNWEHSMLDGHTMMEAVAAIAKGYDGGFAVDDSGSSACVMQPLVWNLDDETTQALPAIHTKSLDLSNGIGVEVLEYAAYGSSFVKSTKNSPDGFLQAAMTLTYFSLRGTLCAPYESVLAKSFKHGRVTVARNMSEVIGDSVKTFDTLASKEEKQAAFRQIVEEVVGRCREAASAQEFDRPFLALRKLAAMEGKRMEICEHAAWARFNDLDLCTSHCGKPPIRFFGYEAPAADGFGVGYHALADSVNFCITHFDKEQAVAFKAALQARLAELQELFS